MREPNRKNWARSYVGQTSPSDRRTGGLGRVAFNSNAQAGVPKRAGVPITLAFSEKYALQKEIVRLSNAAVFDPGVVNVQAGIYTPSDRLALTLQVFFEPETQVNVNPSFIVTPTWSLTRLAINSISGRESPMSQFYPFPDEVTPATANLPDELVIAEGAPELLRANITINTGALTIAYGGSGAKVYLQAKWEPNVQTIPRDELQRLYDRCRITYGNTLIVKNNPT